MHYTEKELDKIALKVLMKVDPLYQSFKEGTQSSFRHSMAVLGDDKAMEYIHKFLQGDEESNAYTYYYNSIRCRVLGLGKGFVEINEIGRVDKTLTSYNNYLEWDKEYWDFQKEHFEEHGSSYYNNEYLMQCGDVWLRWLYEGSLYYVDLNSMYSYLSLYLDDKLSDHINKLIPHEFLEGPENGKETEEGYHIWDYYIDAGGKEDLLNQLKYYTSSEVIPFISTNFSRTSELAEPKVYVGITSTEKFDPCMSVVINNQEAAKSLRFQTFQEDCNKLKAPHKELERIRLDALVEALRMVDHKYKALMEVWDPKVVKLKPKSTKVTTHTNVIDD